MKSACRVLVAALAAAAPFAASPRASAEVTSGPPTKAECADADTKAQQLRRADKLTDARNQLKVCVDPACPALVRDDCAQRIDELDRVQPTVVFDVRDGQGRDMTEVKVSADGQVVAERISGSALAFDPGPHTFVLEARGEKPVTLQLVLREGERARHEAVRIGAPPPAAAPASSSRSGLRTAGLVLGGFGIVGLGIGGAFGGLAAAKWSTAQSDCAKSSTCTPTDNQAANDQKKNATTLATVSTAGIIGGGVLLATGIVLFVVAPSGASGGEQKQAPRAEVIPAVGAEGAGLLVRGKF